MGIYYDAVTTTIYLHDDNNGTGGHAVGSPHTFAEITAAAAAQFVNNGTNKPSYRSTVNVQLGDKVGGTIDATGVAANTTTLEDKIGSTVIFDNTRTLKNRATQTTSWVVNFGTKIGTGNRASGINGPRIFFGAAVGMTVVPSIYGAALFQTVGAMSISPATTGSGEIINCLLQSTATGTAPINIGTSSNKWGVIFNCDISHTTSVQVQSNFFGDFVELVTIGAAAPTAFVNSNAAGFTNKDLAMFGSPTQGDLRWGGTSATAWRLYRPRFTGNAAKFSITTSGFPGLNAGGQPTETWEHWRYDVKIIDGLTGASVSGIPVKLTDTVGNIQVNTTSGSDGQIDFGSGIAANMVAVMDHYAVTTTYTQRHRSPFLVEINTGASANTNYSSQRYYMNWPGYESITTSAGTFEDVADVIPLRPAGGLSTTWIEDSL